MTVGYRRFAAALRAADAAPRPRPGAAGPGVAYVAFACANPALFRLTFGAALVSRHGDLATAHGLASLASDGQLLCGGRSATVLAERILRIDMLRLAAAFRAG